MRSIIRPITRSLLLCALSLAGVSGCGGDKNDDDDKSSAVDKFTGTWKYTSGTTTTSCGGDSQTDTLTGNETVTRGSTSDLLVSDSDCAFKFNVSGNTATALDAQTCTINVGGSNATETVTSLVFSSPDGSTAHVSGTFSVMVAGLTCTISLTGDLQKL